MGLWSRKQQEPKPKLAPIPPKTASEREDRLDRLPASVPRDVPISEMSPDARLDLLAFALEETANKEGDPVSMFNLAAIAEHRGDEDEASKWRVRGATALLLTGAQVDVGLSAMQVGDVAGAVRVYVQAAKIGHLPSTLTLAGLLMKSGELDEAARWLQMHAQAGIGDAMYSLGVIAARQGDSDQAISWHTKAAQAGVKDSTLQLGLLYGARGNFDEMIRWYTEAAGLGIRDAMYNLGNQYQKRGDLERAIPWYTKAADAGDDDAMFAIGSYYMMQNDVERAMHWLRKATAAGNTNAAGTVAALTAPGVQESLSAPGFQDLAAGTLAQQRGDLDEAIRSYTMAAEAGNGEAMFQLVLVYRHQGNLDQCIEWLGKAGEAGNADAITLLRSLSAGN